MRLAIKAAALGLLASVTLAAPATGKLAPRLGSPPFHSLAGPVLAGDAVVWATPAHGGYDVVTKRGAERTSVHVTLKGLAHARDRSLGAGIAASDERVALAVYARACYSRAQCEGHDWPVADEAVLTGPVGGELDRVAGCRGVTECGSGPCPAGAVDASEDAIAYSDCDGVHVRDFAAGASPAARDLPGRRWPRLAGAYVAADDGGDGWKVTVSNWRSGDDVYTIEPAEGYDLQSDGKLAFNGVQWASPAEPFAHTVVNSYISPEELRIANDRIAAVFDNPPYDSSDWTDQGQQFDVLGLDEQPNPDDYTPRMVDPDAMDRMDFDGTRVVWADAVCRHAWLRTWDPASDAPAGNLPITCPLPRIVRGSARVATDRALSLRLECDVPPGPACVGWAQRVGRHGRLLTLRRYSIGEGHAKTIAFPRTGSLCRAGPNRARARVALTPEREPGPPEAVRHTVTARGPTAGLPSC